MNHRSIIRNLLPILLMIPIITSSCNPQGKLTSVLSSPSFIESSPTNTSCQTTTETLIITPFIKTFQATKTSPIPSAIPSCLDYSIPKGTLLVTVLFSGIYSIDIRCQSKEGSCTDNVRKVFNYDGFISEATWAPFGKSIVFAANIGAPPLPPNTGGMVSEMRLFSIPSSGGSPIVISSPDGFVSGIDSCNIVDRIVFERNIEYETKIFIIDSLGNGSSFTHEGRSVFSPSCSSYGQDIAFLTDDNSLFIKHIGNSEHTFVSNNVPYKASWSPDDRLLSFTKEISPSESGTCIALTNLNSTKPPQVLSPCPIPGLGYDAIWSPDGKYLLSRRYQESDKTSEFVLSEAPSKTSNPMVFDYLPRSILKIDSTPQSSKWIGPHHIIIIDNYKAVVVDVNKKCISQIVDLPQGANYPDWFASQ